MTCQEAAFAFFGGAPLEVQYDNMRTVVIGGVPMVPASIGFSPVSATSPTITASSRGYAAPTERRPKARSNGSSII
jgi:hypothetical protein